MTRFGNWLIIYVVSPGDFVRPRICFDGALEVDVVPFLDVGRVQAGAEG